MHGDSLLFLTSSSSSQLNETERDDDDHNGGQYNGQYYVEYAATCVSVTYRNTYNTILTADRRQHSLNTTFNF